VTFLGSFVVSLALGVGLVGSIQAQETAMDAGTLAHALDRVATTGRVLYVAAHPDDENTRLLAYLANSRHLTAAYLSMTRGGGGQNLIGPEQDELLDVIRTTELLAARRLDGAEQRFTRMRDFGYSKSAEETLAVWGREEALADLVWVIRTFQPDLIISRFDVVPPNHGHHTASAILAREAFEAAGDPQRFPEQIRPGVEPWRAGRLLRNVSPWRENPPPEGAIPLDVGEYDVRLGLGYGEIAALSRSQHKSQGFGVAGERGPLIERFVPVAGTRPEGDILAGIDVGWGRFGEPAASLIAALNEARAKLERDHPERALPSLLAAHRALDRLPDVSRVRGARQALETVIAGAAGLFVRATAARPAAVPGSEVEVSVEVVLRRPASMTLRRVVFPGIAPIDERFVLGVNEKKVVSRIVPISRDAAISAPYWLASPALPGRQVVADQTLIGAAEGPPALAVTVELAAGDRVLRLDVPVVHAWTDRVHGERVRRFLIVPPATVSPARQAVMFPNGRPATVLLQVRAGQNDLQGEIVLDLPTGWRAEPERVSVALARTGDEASVRFEVRPPAGAGPLEIEPAIEAAGRRWSWREDVIDYPHIPMQVVLRPATLRLVPLALRLPEGTVGYIPGSGDTIADDLAHVGAEIEVIDEQAIRAGDLDRYAAIVVGIRAYNTQNVVRSAHERLMRYIEGGGTVVVQYNTTSEWSPFEGPVGPYPLVIGRGRVTDESAAMVPVDPEDPFLLGPNRIAAEDFEGWVQERGLYFAESWDDRYRPLFSVHDPGEEPLLGGALVARHGRGRYVYTGLAFFRQLPAGVPGAYRLFANLLTGDVRGDPAKR
jgi:LmbE family N-acetylglucosaminyl deacetylase